MIQDNKTKETTPEQIKCLLRKLQPNVSADYYIANSSRIFNYDRKGEIKVEIDAVRVGELVDALTENRINVYAANMETTSSGSQCLRINNYAGGYVEY